MNKNNIKTLLLRDLTMYFPKDIWKKYKNIDIVTPSRKISFPKRILRRILNHFNIFLVSLNGDWIKKIDKYDRIILFDNACSKDKRVCYIYRKLKNNNTKLIYWYWNPIFVANSVHYLRTKAPLFDLFTFDLVDSKKYNIKSNTTFYSKYIVLPKNKIEFDVYFVGNNKGRFAKIMKIKKILTDLKITTFFYVIDKENKLPRISSKDNLLNIAKSNSVLDILQEGQNGLTLRVMESIFFEKKLITNDKSIINYPFYCPDNIFIIDYDNYDELPEFLRKPYEKLDHNIVNHYDIESWTERFGELV